MSRWKRLQRILIGVGIAGLIIAFSASIVAAAYFAGVFPDWTGFGPPLLDAQGHELPHAKTLWDWLGLLLVPLVITVGGYLFTRAENSQARNLQEQREEKAQELEKDRAREAALQAYLDQMTALLLHEKLRTSQPDDEVRSVARARTLTALRVLDGVRKATILQFLYEANLIGGSKQEDGGVPETIDAIVCLEEANLDGAELRGAHLKGANLYRTRLEGANLSGADLDGAPLAGSPLQGARLQGAHLQGANLILANLEGANLFGAYIQEAHLILANLKGAYLFGADLSRADLTHCTVARERLAQASSLEGATLSFLIYTQPSPE